MSIYAKKASELQSMLSDCNMLAKQASQTIKHIDVVAGQNGLGQQMEEQQHAAVAGISADDPDQVPAPQDTPRELQGGIQESINNQPSVAIGGVTKMNEDTVKKSASLYNRVAAILNANLSTAAPIHKSASAATDNDVPTGIGVMRKFASYMNTADPSLLESIHEDFRKLASSNPLFHQACEAVALRKLAAEAEALAEATGTTPEEAAQMIGDSIESDPEAAAELAGEIEAEGAAQLAAAEQQAIDDAAQLEQAAATASENLGVDITPEDVEAAYEEIDRAAEQMGVSPEDLILAAAEEMNEGDSDDPEADAAAEELLAAAAEEGISPEELIAELSSDLVDEDEVPEDYIEDAQAVDKTACLHKLASTKRGQNIARALQGLYNN